MICQYTADKYGTYKVSPVLRPKIGNKHLYASTGLGKRGFSEMVIYTGY